MQIVDWTLWENAGIALLTGQPAPHAFIEALRQALLQLSSHTGWLYGTIAFMLVALKFLAGRLGRGFLKGIKQLPLRYWTSKQSFMLTEILVIGCWWGLMLYVALMGLLNLYYQDITLPITQFGIKFSKDWFIGSLLGFIAGIVLIRLVARYIEPPISKRIDLKRNKRSEGLSDIRDVEDMMAKTREFDPLKYFKKENIFTGLDEDNKPIYIASKIFLESHIQIMGRTGSGKGVAAMIMLYQAIQNGIATVIFEPKKGGDEWAPHVLKHACEAAGVKFHYIVLEEVIAQINLLIGITSDELDELLQAGMGIEDKGADGDYYRLKDRKAARIAANFAGVATSFPHLFHLMNKEWPDVMQVADSFSDKLESLAEIPAVQTESGLDLRQALKNGDCIYINGSTRRPQIKLLQKMVLLRILQIIERQDRLESHRHVTLFVDELKYFLTRPVLDALATIRDHDCNLILAHQGPGDLFDVTKDISGQACYNCVVNNTNIKLIYKLNDPPDRERAAIMTGEKVVQRDSKEVLTNVGMGELIETDKRHIMSTTEPLYSQNVFAALAKRVGVLIGVGIAHLCFTSPIKVKKTKIESVEYPRTEDYEAQKNDPSDMNEMSLLHKPNEQQSTQEYVKNDAPNDEELIQFFDEELHHTFENEQGEGG